MADILHIQPTGSVQGFRWESGTGSPGIGCVRGTASDQTKVAGAAPTSILGVLELDQQSPAAGDLVSLRLAAPGAITYVQAGGAFAVDAKLTTNASGQFVTATTGNHILAKALAAATAAGDLVPAVVQDADATA